MNSFKFYKMYTFSVLKSKSHDLLLQYQIRTIIVDFIIKVVKDKKAVFGSIVIFLFGFIGHAQEGEDLNQKYDFKYGSLITKYKNEVTEYKYGSFDDLKDGIDEVVQGFDFSLENEQCEVTIELKLELANGAANILVSESISTNCEKSSAIEAIKRLKTFLIK
jgi:hypothetical protein